MRNRMDKYNEYSNKKEIRRTNKNKDLYDNFYTNNIYYDERGQVNNAYEYDSNTSPYSSRSNYQKVKDYRQLLKPKEISSKEELKRYLEMDEKINLDLNEIMQRAKKNRDIEEQEEERKRKIRNSQYNIFEGATLEELKKRKEEIDKEKDEIEDLINTISSKSLKEDIEKEASKDLLSDLISDDETDKVGTTGNNSVITESVSKLILDKEEERKNKSEVSDIDRSFYTKSMDLSDEDFETEDEFAELNEKKHTGIKVFLVLVLLIVISVAIYLIVVGK
ncbi:MAG: hypothetical protein ACI4OT_00235 [Bacilli bacterium]